ncbi:MAG TPA: hypothetical protein VGE45_00475 [Chloroflexia bacterium]|jgi:hypothetical protein
MIQPGETASFLAWQNEQLSKLRELGEQRRAAGQRLMAAKSKASKKMADRDKVISEVFEQEMQELLAKHETEMAKSRALFEQDCAAAQAGADEATGAYNGAWERFIELAAERGMDYSKLLEPMQIFVGGKPVEMNVGFNIDTLEESNGKRL